MWVQKEGSGKTGVGDEMDALGMTIKMPLKDSLAISLPVAFPISAHHLLHALCPCMNPPLFFQNS